MSHIPYTGPDVAWSVCLHPSVYCSHNVRAYSNSYHTRIRCVRASSDNRNYQSIRYLPGYQPGSFTCCVFILVLQISWASLMRSQIVKVFSRMSAPQHYYPITVFIRINAHSTYYIFHDSGAALFWRAALIGVSALKCGAYLRAALIDVSALKCSAYLRAVLSWINTVSARALQLWVK